jgi:DNA-binding NarL/FixJ family response regulator
MVVIYVSQSPGDVCLEFFLAAEKYGFTPVQLFSLNELLLHVSSNDFCSNSDKFPKIILLDWTILYSVDGAVPAQVLTTISTMLACQNSTHSTRIIISVNRNTPETLQADIYRTPVTGIIPQSSWLGDLEREIAYTEILAGNDYVPNRLFEKLRKRPIFIESKPKDMLTTKQREILMLICDRGGSNKSIAKVMNLSESTVKLHITALMKKAGVQNRTQLALFSKHLMQSTEA